MVGSHLDTQPTGGKYDGVLGVLSGLEILRTLNDLGIKTKHPIEVVNWTNEEGSRYAPAMIASGVFAGAYTQDYAYELKDAEGKEFGEELKRIGYVGDEPVGKRPLKAFFEYHIEQGPILEAENIDIGVVTHGQGQRWFDVKLTGFESHAGSTPMPRRRDALLGAAKLVQAVNEIALNHAPHAVGTVGVLKPYPGSRNVIPGSVEMTIDFRHPIDATLSEMKAAFSARGGKDLRRRKAHLRGEGGLLLRAGGVRQGLRRRRPPRRRAARLLASRHRLRRRARRLLHRPRRADLDDLLPLRRRHQP